MLTSIKCQVFRENLVKSEKFQILEKQYNYTPKLIKDAKFKVKRYSKLDMLKNEVILMGRVYIYNDRTSFWSEPGQVIIY